MCVFACPARKPWRSDSQGLRVSGSLALHEEAVLLKRGQSGLLLVGVAALILALDQLTKAWVLRHLAPQQPWNPISALRPVVTLTYVTNTGAAFGLFPGGSAFFVIVSVVVIAAILLFYRQVPAQLGLARAALALQCGGAVGNLADRLRHGHVIDFIDFHFWPVFNVADSAIVVGVVILAYYLLFKVDKEPGQQQQLEAERG